MERIHHRPESRNRASILVLIALSRQQSGSMFRTHLGRPLDLSLTSNRLIIGLTALAAAVGGALWLSGNGPDAWLAPVHTFIVWALVRELDPDRHVTALVAGATAGIWVLLGFELASALALGGLLLAGRIVLNPVGLRLLNTDLVAMVVAATVISFTAAGWVAGSGIALAIYIDARMSEEPRPASLFASAGAAVGATAMATVTDALPDNLSIVEPLVVVSIGLLALAIVVRDPLPVLSPVDHTDAMRMSAERLHASRVLTVVLVFLSALLMGGEARGLIPVVIAFALVLVSEEVKRIRMPTL